MKRERDGVKDRGGEEKDEGTDDEKDEGKGEAKDEEKEEKKDEGKGEEKDEGKGEAKDEEKDEEKDEGKGDEKVEDKDEERTRRKDKDSEREAAALRCEQGPASTSVCGAVEGALAAEERANAMRGARLAHSARTRVGGTVGGSARSMSEGSAATGSARALAPTPATGATPAGGSASAAGSAPAAGSTSWLEASDGAGPVGAALECRTGGEASMRSWTASVLADIVHPPAEESSSTSRRSPRMMYSCDRSLLLTDLGSRFVILRKDAATLAFLETCRASSVLTVAAFNLLRNFWSITDTNAWLGGGQMHVLSEEHVRTLLDWPAAPPPPGPAPSRQRRRLLDIGAGDGNVTRHLAPLFDEVVATEVSPGMVDRLRARGYTAVQTAELTSDTVGTDPYDVVSLLNVLDRCDKPKSLLKAIRPLLRPGSGRLLMAVVLPFCPFVEDGQGQRPPTERLAVTSNRWEYAVNQLVQRVCIPCGYDVVKLARVPYYSQVYSVIDDPAFVTLDDVVLVLAPSADVAPAPATPAPV